MKLEKLDEVFTINNNIKKINLQLDSKAYLVIRNEKDIILNFTDKDFQDGLRQFLAQQKEIYTEKLNKLLQE